MSSKTNGAPDMKNELLAALETVSTPPIHKSRQRFEASLQINIHGSDGYEYQSLKGTKGEIKKYISGICKKAQDVLFLETTRVIYLSLSYDYEVIRNIKIDLYKQNY